MGKNPVIHENQAHARLSLRSSGLDSSTLRTGISVLEEPLRAPPPLSGGSGPEEQACVFQASMPGSRHGDLEYQDIIHLATLPGGVLRQHGWFLAAVAT